MVVLLPFAFFLRRLSCPRDLFEVETAGVVPLIAPGMAKEVGGGAVWCSEESGEGECTEQTAREKWSEEKVEEVGKRRGEGEGDEERQQRESAFNFVQPSEDDASAC
jgi:hypothetical protein